MENWTPEKLTEEIESGAAILLKIWKRGCGPCKLSEPALERVQAADQSGMRFGQIVVDDHPEMYEITETEVLPTFFVFRNKEMKGKLIGFKGLAKLQQFVAEALAS